MIKNLYKHMFRFAVATLTILSVNLLTSKLSDYLIGYKNAAKPLTFTLIAMGIITVIFYPLFMRMEAWLNIMSAKLLVKPGRSVGGKFIGLISVYLLCLSVLFYFYAKMWYNINIPKEIFHGTILKLF